MRCASFVIWLALPWRSRELHRNLHQVGACTGFAPVSNDALLAELTALVKADKSPRCVVFFSNGAFGGIIKKFAQSA